MRVEYREHDQGAGAPAVFNLVLMLSGAFRSLPHDPINDSMRTEVITRRDDLVVRRLVLEPGEAMPWHTDPCHRLTVVVRGDLLRIEFRDNGDEHLVPVTPGMVDWDHPEARVHRGVNAGTQPYEEVVIFFLPSADADPQPAAT